MKDLLVKELVAQSRPDRRVFRPRPALPRAPGLAGFLRQHRCRGLPGPQGSGCCGQAQVQAGVEKELVYNFSTELAKTLYKSNWSAAERLTEQKNKAAKLASAATPLDKGSLYEATVALKNVSDREEAKSAGPVGRERAGEGSPTSPRPEKRDLQKAKDVLKGW